MVGKRIRELRNEKGITLKKLGEILNLGESAMSMYENDKRNPDYDTLLKIAGFFNVSTDYLLGKTSFRKPTELFELWSGQNNPYFESSFDFGGLLKEVRESQGITQEEVSEALGTTEYDIDEIESGTLPLNYDWAEKYANFLGTTVEDIFIDNNMGDSLIDIPLNLLNHYQEQGMSESEMAEAYNKFKAEQERDAMIDDATRYEPKTIAAHHDGDDWTEEELDEIERFKEFVRMKRSQQE